MDISPDLRLEWLRDRIGELFGVYEIDYTNVMLQKYYDDFKKFMEDEIQEIKDINKKVVFVNRTFYDKLVETTTTYLELVQPPPPVEVVEITKDKKGKKGKGVKPQKSEDETPRSGTKIFYFVVLYFG